MNQAPGILIVTPFFAPQTHAAVFRAHKLAKYLPQRGFRVHVLTVDSNYHYKEDPKLLDDLKNVTIHRAKYIEPSLRGLRTRLLNRNVQPDFGQNNIEDSKGEGANTESFSLNALAKSELKKVYRKLLSDIVQDPDYFCTWYKPAKEKMLKVCKENNIDLVLTSSHPYTTLLLGRAAKEAGYKWLADFRDPLTYGYRTRSANSRILKHQRQIERDAFIHADAITALSSSYAAIYSEIYPELQEPIFIPTGADDEYLDTSDNTRSNEIIFVGEFLPDYSFEFFEAFNQALSDPGFSQKELKVRIFGYQTINESRLGPTIDRLNLRSHVTFEDHIPQAELYKIIQACDACLLQTGGYYNWWTNFAKMVDYVALEKPVIAAVSRLSEARKVLEDSGLGLFLEKDISEATRQLITWSKEGFANCVHPNKKVSNRYKASNQADEFAELINRLLRV